MVLGVLLFLKKFGPFLEKSILGISKQKKKHLTFFDGVYIVSMKQFHKESVEMAVSSGTLNPTIPYLTKSGIKFTINSLDRWHTRKTQSTDVKVTFNRNVSRTVIPNSTDCALIGLQNYQSHIQTKKSESASRAYIRHKWTTLGRYTKQ